jgi:D-3-phosphoglycerate dehydrogenase
VAYKVVRTIEGARLDEREYLNIVDEFVVIPCQTEEEIIAAARDAHVVQTFLQPFTRRVIGSLERCRLIQSTGTGYEGIDIQAATDYGICVSYPGDYCTDEVAEHTIALLLACARKIPRLDRAVREGKWDSFRKPGIRALWTSMFRIKGQTLGLIGFGRIAREVASRAKGLGLRIIAFDPYVAPEIFREQGAEGVTLEHLLENSDYICINSALTKDNTHLLGVEEFKKMKNTAYLINTSRAEIVDEKALLTALERGYVAGAALDVAEGEGERSIEDPLLPNGHALLQFDNLILTAHSAFYSEQSMQELKQRPYDEIVRIRSGQWPKYFLNPEVKENYRKRWGGD